MFQSDAFHVTSDEAWKHSGRKKGMAGKYSKETAWSSQVTVLLLIVIYMQCKTMIAGGQNIYGTKAI